MDAKDYLLVIREKGKMTQDQVAKRTGIPQPTISKIERGRVTGVMARTHIALQALYTEVMATPISQPPDASLPAHQAA